MTQNEFIRETSALSGIPMSRIKEVLFAVEDSIAEALAAGDDVKLYGFGTFDTKIRKGHKGRNLYTKQPIEIPDKLVPVFRPGSMLQDAAERAASKKEKKR